MKNINEMTIDELNALADEIKARKATLRETAKTEKANSDASMTDKVNAMITDGTLKLGMKVRISYYNDEIVGTLAGVLDNKRATFTVDSTDFKSTKEGTENDVKRRYINKSKFIEIVD